MLNQELKLKVLPIAYLGAPYTDPDPNIRQFRMRAVTQLVDDLFEQTRLVYSPLTHNLSIDPIGIFRDYKTWLSFDHNMLSRCNSLIIFKLPGWKESRELSVEIDLAKSLNLIIEEIEPTEEFLAEIQNCEKGESIIHQLMYELKKMRVA